MIQASILKNDEKLLYERLVELCCAVDQKNKAHFTFFLNPREQKIATAAAKSSPSLSELFGGYKDAQRKIMGIFPDSTDYNDYPITAIEIMHNKNDVLSHSDVLGSIMNMGISRGSVGDILLSETSCTVMCTNIASGVFVDELVQIGRKGVKCKLRPLEGIESKQKYKIVTGTVSSNRIDSLVALLAKCSRAKAVEYISSGLVLHDYTVQNKLSAPFFSGDTITIRRHGKFIVDTIGQPTRKDRFPVECRKYI